MPLTIKYGPQNFGGKTCAVTVTPVITAGVAYTAGQIVGGVLHFTHLLDNGPSGIIQSAYLTSLSAQSAGFKLYPFWSNPTHSTWTDQTNPAIAAGDVPLLAGPPIAFTSPDTNLGTPIIYGTSPIGLAIAPQVNAGVTDFYAVLLTTGTPTFTTAADLSVTLVVLQD